MFLVAHLSFKKINNLNNVYEIIKQNNFLPRTVKDDIDPDDMCDDGAGSDIEGSETDSKMGDSKKDSKGGGSKPRR